MKKIIFYVFIFIFCIKNPAVGDYAGLGGAMQAGTQPKETHENQKTLKKENKGKVAGIRAKSSYGKSTINVKSANEYFWATDQRVYECDNDLGDVGDKIFLYYTDSTDTESIKAKQCHIEWSGDYFSDVSVPWCTNDRDYSYKCTGKTIKLIKSRYICAKNATDAVMIGTTGFSDGTNVGCKFNAPDTTKNTTGKPQTQANSDKPKSTAAQTSDNQSHKASDECATGDLPQFAISGKYFRRGDKLVCAAQSCKTGTYLVVNASRTSQGWCVAATYCNKKTGTHLNIIDETKTDLQCLPDDANNNGEETENLSEPAPHEISNAQEQPTQHAGDSNDNPDDLSEQTELPSSDGDDTQSVSPGNQEQSNQITPDADNNVPQHNDVPESDTAITPPDKINELRTDAANAKAHEQSAVNKLIGAAGIGTAGIGGMQLASAMAEQNADADAEADMAAYLATFKCDFGQGQNIKGGEANIELPGGNDLFNLRQQYVALAATVRDAKHALGMEPGKEEQEINDNTHLYNNTAIGKSDGAYTSLSRALSDETSADAAAWAEQKSDTVQKLKTGATVAGVGTVVGIAGNIVVDAMNNRKQNKNTVSDSDAASDDELK